MGRCPDHPVKSQSKKSKVRGKDPSFRRTPQTWPEYFSRAPSLSQGRAVDRFRPILGVRVEVAAPRAENGLEARLVKSRASFFKKSSGDGQVLRVWLMATHQFSVSNSHSPGSSADGGIQRVHLRGTDLLSGCIRSAGWQSVHPQVRCDQS
jgi:hypothetical protein